VCLSQPLKDIPRPVGKTNEVEFLLVKPAIKTAVELLKFRGVIGSSGEPEPSGPETTGTKLTRDFERILHYPALPFDLGVEAPDDDHQEELISRNLSVRRLGLPIDLRFDFLKGAKVALKFLPESGRELSGGLLDGWGECHAQGPIGR